MKNYIGVQLSTGVHLHGQLPRYNTLQGHKVLSVRYKTARSFHSL